jgi:hypothetical protein
MQETNNTLNEKLDKQVNNGHKNKTKAEKQTLDYSVIYYVHDDEVLFAVFLTPTVYFSTLNPIFVCFTEMSFPVTKTTK